MGSVKNDRFGLLLIAGSIVVTALIVGLFHAHQLRLHQEKVRVLGVSLARALSSAELSHLVKDRRGSSLMNALVNLQRSDDYAYAVLEAKSGERLFEIVSPGTIVPAAPLPSSDPSAWFGEQPLTSPGDRREIRDFFAPVLEQGELAGFVRVGFFAKPQSLILDGNMSYLALLALPVFLLTGLSYFVIQREVRPLARLTTRLDEAQQSYGVMPAQTGPLVELRDFIQRFDRFIELVQTRVRDAEKERLEAQTSNRLLAYKQEKISTVLESLPEAVLVVDEASKATYANSKLETLLGVTQQDVVGEPAQNWCKQAEVMELLTRIRQRTTPLLQTAKAEYSPKESPDRRISVSAYPLFSPRDETALLGTLIVLREITEEYHALKAGAQFVSQVSHELKTPLSNIMANSELLRDYAGLEETERVSAVNVIHAETERATALINNLLNISKIESGTLPIERVRVRMSELLSDACGSMNGPARSKQVSLQLQLPPDLGTARVDKGLFRIAIDNLISNAVKYSKPGGSVTISAEMSDDLQMRIKVRDQGIGISTADCEKVFEKYYRSTDPEAASRGGHGLGLFLARQIVQLHHGTITVSSEVGKGTEFVIEFPVQTQQLTDSGNA